MEKRGQAQGTHKEGGDQIVAHDVSKHIGFSEPEVAHGTETDPEGIVDDPQLCVKLFLLASIRTVLREFIRARVSDNS